MAKKSKRSNYTSSPNFEEDSFASGSQKPASGARKLFPGNHSEVMEKRERGESRANSKSTNNNGGERDRNGAPDGAHFVRKDGAEHSAQEYFGDISWKINRKMNGSRAPSKPRSSKKKYSPIPKPASKKASPVHSSGSKESKEKACGSIKSSPGSSKASPGPMEFG